MSRHLVPAKPRSRSDIERLALLIIQKYQPRVITEKESFDIERFFDCELEKFTKVSTDYQKLQTGIYGYTDSVEKVCVISQELADDPDQKYFLRSTMAHEIGHAILHVRDYVSMRSAFQSIHKKYHSLLMYREKDIVAYKNPEWQAWRFAGAILMPTPAFIAAVREGLDDTSLSERFGVNPAFVKVRKKALGLTC